MFREAMCSPPPCRVAKIEKEPRTVAANREPSGFVGQARPEVIQQDYESHRHLLERVLLRRPSRQQALPSGRHGWCRSGGAEVKLPRAVESA